MPATPITDLSALNVAWLSAALSGVGAPPGGWVADALVEPAPSTWSKVARIRPSYRPGAPADLPAALLLKICAGDGFGPSEYHFYTRDYAGLADAPIPRAYAAAYAGSPPAYHILMEDLSATHGPLWEREPDIALGGALAEALAALHAFRWGAGRIAELGEPLPTQATVDRYIGHIRRGLEPLLAIGGDDLRPEWRPALLDMFARHPALLAERARDAERLTLVHGDANPGNILAPHSDGGRIYLIDRQPFDWSLTVWTGPSDLAYLMLWWPIEARRQLEQPVLRRYHDALLRRGVAGYTWEQLWRDYRLATVQSVYVAVEWCVLEEDRERMRWLWTRHLERAMAAVADLRCAELWGQG